MASASGYFYYVKTNRGLCFSSLLEIRESPENEVEGSFGLGGCRGVQGRSALSGPLQDSGLGSPVLSQGYTGAFRPNVAQSYTPVVGSDSFKDKTYTGQKA